MSDRVQVAFNRALIEDTCASLWAELLVELRHLATPLPLLTFYSLWPKRATETSPGVAKDTEWARVLAPLYSLLSQHDVLRIEEPDPHTLSLNPEKALAIRARWTTTSIGRWGRGLRQVPHEIREDRAGLEVRSEWLKLVLRHDVQRNIAVARERHKPMQNLRRSTDSVERGLHELCTNSTEFSGMSGICQTF